MCNSEMLNPEIYVEYFSSCSAFTQPPSSHFLFREKFAFTSGIRNRLEEFSYGQAHCTTDKIRTYIDKANMFIYIGEVKEGTDDTPHGIGIRIWKLGGINECNWKDGKIDGRGRVIWNTGRHYIGEWKEESWIGEGTYYKNGVKYTGQWVGDWTGQGEINYPDGTKYTGHWKYLARHGFGTLYSADGQILNQGKWEYNKYKGEE